MRSKGTALAPVCKFQTLKKNDSIFQQNYWNLSANFNEIFFFNPEKSMIHWGKNFLHLTDKLPSAELTSDPGWPGWTDGAASLKKPNFRGLNPGICTGAGKRPGKSWARIPYNICNYPRILLVTKDLFFFQIWISTKEMRQPVPLTEFTLVSELSRYYTTKQTSSRLP